MVSTVVAQHSYVGVAVVRILEGMKVGRSRVGERGGRRRREGRMSIRSVRAGKSSPVVANCLKHHSMLTEELLSRYVELDLDERTAI